MKTSAVTRFLITLVVVLIGVLVLTVRASLQRDTTCDVRGGVMVHNRCISRSVVIDL